MSITDVDYAWMSATGQRPVITNYSVGALYAPGTPIKPLLQQCLNDDTCLAVTQAGGQIQFEHGTAATGWKPAAATSYVLKQKRNVLCNAATIPEPYNTYCLTNYCMQAENFGKCDLLYTPYCKSATGMSDPRCACLNSPVAEFQYNPLCQDRACLGGGYGTATMMASKASGCNIVDCSTAITLINKGGIQLTDPTINQRCGPGAQTSQTVSKSGGAVNVAGASTTTIVIVVVLVLALGGVIYYVRTKRRK